MYHHRRFPQFSFFIAVTCTMLFVTSLMSACTSGQRKDTLHATLLSVNAARDGFTAWDSDHQQRIVETADSREVAETSLSDYRAKRTPVINGFELTYRVIAMAATQSDEVSLKAALAKAGELIDAINKLTEKGRTP